MTVLASWVLDLMVATQPAAPWRSTYEATADAIAETCNATTELAPERCAALAVSVAWYEGAFKPDARGDCTKDGKSVPSVGGVCTAGSVPHSFCEMQINETNLAGLGTSASEITRDVRVCIRSGVRMLLTSLRVCRAAPARERLRWYAAGGNGCTVNEDARRKSTHRVALAEKLLREHPAP